MNPNKKFALSLRRQGKSYKEIVKVTGVPKSTLSGWLQHQKWSVAIRRKLSRIQNENARVRMIAITDKAREQRQIVYLSYRENAQTTFEGYFKESLFVAGVMLYWGEGDNKLSNGLIRISNSDPMVLKFFHAFVRRYLPELYPKLKMSLVLYPDLEDVASCEYWSEKIGISLDRFMKSQYIKGRSKKRTLPYGTAQMYVPSKANKYKLLEWIQLARNNIQHAGIV